MSVWHVSGTTQPFPRRVENSDGAWPPGGGVRRQYEQPGRLDDGIRDCQWCAGFLLPRAAEPPRHTRGDRQVLKHVRNNAFSGSS